eukprot:TRINITY_DN10702_c1_g1_i1.p1 TRINITY_DN10702_c1_g1~~TRINITY_DN10702_c1_g1_i1.p1  ORF type:complete len:411 (+),score=49.41 TRINITY_DN10702_c1_g1_i1:131-1234(+)
MPDAWGTQIPYYCEYGFSGPSVRFAACRQQMQVKIDDYGIARMVPAASEDGILGQESDGSRDCKSPCGRGKRDGGCRAADTAVPAAVSVGTGAQNIVATTFVEPKADSIDSVSPKTSSSGTGECMGGGGGGIDARFLSPSNHGTSLQRHDGADGESLVTLLRKTLAGAKAAGTAAVACVEVTGRCFDDQPLEIVHGEDVELRGVGGEGPEKAALILPGLRIDGGCLRVSNLVICATEENRVNRGHLHCSKCFITSRRGCGICCLQRAKVSLVDCNVSHSLRSGVGVNGKNAEIELRNCNVCQNNFSGLGVNHHARSIVLNGTRFNNNGYHGVWLNTGVSARWLGGEMSGNKRKAKDGPGTLHGYTSS